ncbi:energy transducer TonB [Flavobacterium sp. DG2-3]|uniref:energy transducer TonB n=1 Tax=Flavobacterium sp. DG2-3 TaxID=3068317 RepID=UPI0027401BF6|nr:hypothetical protein [Flavobacterium sp. DG2-3]MDP5202237.1 hypothetical protein [Flavobacterium sp. DG2-3]
MIKKILLIVIMLGLVGCKKENEKKRPEKTINRVDTPKTVVQKPIKEEKIIFNNDNKIYKIMDVDTKPEFIGGEFKFHAFIKKNYVRTERIVKNEASGGIFPRFIIEKDGSLSDIEVMRDFGYGSGEELVRVLKLCPAWKPAIKNGQPVRCLYSFPYYVLLNDN